jgi:ADP-heptose:LPS heptosyltransferase
MGIRQFIDLKLITLLVDPFTKEKPFEFRSALRDASRFLVLYQGKDPVQLEKTLTSLRSVFPEGGIHVLRLADGPVLPRKPAGISETAIPVPKQTYWKLSRSEELKAFIRKRFDVFLDLDQGNSPAGAYLCRAMRIPVRIGMVKPQSEKFYNFVYNGKAEASSEQKIDGLIRFLKSFVSST